MRCRLLFSLALILLCFSGFAQSTWPKSDYLKEKEKETQVPPYPTSSSQEPEEVRKLRLPLWSFHAHNTNIYGVSVGAFSYEDDYRNTISNGVRLELPGVGMFALTGFMNPPPSAGVDSLRRGFKRSDFEFSEIINGINISTGSWGDMNYNGLTLALVAQHGNLCNGVSFVGLFSSLDKANGLATGLAVNNVLQMNGLQVSLFVNRSILMSGCQISAYNVAKNSRGVQIGIVNETEDSKGIQIGLVNINEYRTLPLINWNFRKKE
jgi:hypothetical protein